MNFCFLREPPLSWICAPSRPGTCLCL
jgi:hypothetical protein